MIEQDWPQTVGRVVNGTTTFCADDLNGPIIDPLTQRTEWLKTQVLSMDGSRGFTLPITGLSPDCRVGDFIYFNPTTAMYDRALASWSAADTIVRADGSVIPSTSSYAVGLLTSIIAADTQDGDTRTGTVLCTGWTTDPVVINNALGASPQVGNYFLSESEPGKTRMYSTGAPKGVSVFCCSYMDAGSDSDTGVLYVNPQMPAYGTHSHGYVEFKDTAISITASELSEYTPIGRDTIPEGETDTSPIRLLDLTDNAEAVALIAQSNTALTLFLNEYYRRPSTWCIVEKNSSEGSRYLLTRFSTIGTTGNADTYTLFATAPNLRGEDLVKTLDTKSKFLTVGGVYGNIRVNTQFTATERGAHTGEAVVKLDDTTLAMGPVVQQLHAGPGIEITQYADNGTEIPGVKVISAANVLNNYIDLNLCNLNSALVGTTDDETSYVFPAGVTSSITGTARLPHFIGTGIDCEAVLVFKGNGGTIAPAVYAKIQPMPGAAAVLAVNTINPPVDGIATDDTTKYYALKVSLGTAASDALTTLKIQFNSPSTDIVMLSASVRLVTASE